MDTRANPTQFAAAMGWQCIGWKAEVKASDGVKARPAQPAFFLMSDGETKVPYSAQLQRDIETAIAKGARGAGDVAQLRSAT